MLVIALVCELWKNRRDPVVGDFANCRTAGSEESGIRGPRTGFAARHTWAGSCYRLRVLEGEIRRDAPPEIGPSSSCWRAIGSFQRGTARSSPRTPDPSPRGRAWPFVPHEGVLGGVQLDLVIDPGAFKASSITFRPSSGMWGSRVPKTIEELARISPARGGRRRGRSRACRCGFRSRRSRSSPSRRAGGRPGRRGGRRSRSRRRGAGPRRRGGGREEVEHGANVGVEGDDGKLAESSRAQARSASKSRTVRAARSGGRSRGRRRRSRSRPVAGRSGASGR